MLTPGTEHLISKAGSILLSLFDADEFKLDQWADLSTYMLGCDKLKYSFLRELIFRHKEMSCETWDGQLLLETGNPEPCIFVNHWAESRAGPP